MVDSASGGVNRAAVPPVNGVTAFAGEGDGVVRRGAPGGDKGSSRINSTGDGDGVGPRRRGVFGGDHDLNCSLAHRQIDGPAGLAADDGRAIHRDAGIGVIERRRDRDACHRIGDAGGVASGV